MNLVQQSPERLEFEHRPSQWIIGLGIVCAVLLFGLLSALFDHEFGGAAIAGLMLSGLGWVWVTRVFLTVRLIIDRTAGMLRISSTSLFGEQIRERALGELSGAVVETRYSESDSSAQPGLVLQFGSERHRVTLFKPDPADLLQAAHAIEAWLRRGSSLQTESGEKTA